MEEKSSNATITYREDLTDELAVVRIKPDEPLTYTPGQYCELAIPEENPSEKLVRRAYSIASAPSQSGDLEFFIVKVEGGAFTPILLTTARREGCRVWMNPKVKGKFTLDLVPPGKDLILVATGTGVAPFISMIREYVSNPPWRNVVLVHCTRLSSDLGYRKEMESLAATDPRVVYLPTVTREPDTSDWCGERGRVQRLFEPERFVQLTGVELNPDECQLMLCGNPDMIDTVQDHLAGLGFKPHTKKEPGQIHFERYW